MSLLPLLLGACNGCQPQPPSSSERELGPETVDLPDAGETGETGSVLPPRCDRPETEPNDAADVEDLPMEVWVCGNFAAASDYDWFSFTMPEPGWVRVAVEAALRGSKADPVLTLNLPAEDQGAQKAEGHLSTDPELVFPTGAAGTFTLSLAEGDRLYGDDYTWFLIASITKQPIEWTFEEAEPNDAMESAEELALGETVFGLIGDAGDHDWFHVVTEADTATLTLRVEGYAHGSAANTMLQGYDPDLNLLFEDFNGEIDYDRDPFLELREAQSRELYIRVLNEYPDKGSMFHWYTLTVEVTETGTAE